MHIATESISMQRKVIFVVGSTTLFQFTEKSSLRRSEIVMFNASMQSCKVSALIKWSSKEITTQ